MDKEQFRAEWLKQLRRLDDFMEKGSRKVLEVQTQTKLRTEERGVQTPLAWAPPTPPVPSEAQPRLTLAQSCALARKLLGFDHAIQNPSENRLPGIPSSDTSFAYFQELQSAITSDPSEYKVPTVPRLREMFMPSDGRSIPTEQLPNESLCNSKVYQGVWIPNLCWTFSG